MLTISPVELLQCLPSVLLNHYNAYHQSCWTATMLTISPVKLLHCLPSVLLNCYNAYHLSCWTATMLTISPVKLLQCLPSVLLNRYNAYHLSCWTAGVCLDHVELRWITSPKGSVPESEAQFIVTFPIYDRGQQPDNISLLVCCKDVKEDVASCASKIDWVLVTLVMLCLRKDSKKVTYLLSSIFREGNIMKHYEMTVRKQRVFHRPIVGILDYLPRHTDTKTEGTFAVVVS